jgi:hypothetical protein
VIEEVVMEWPAMVFLGAYHGINPGMGWLFAVALGLQQGSALGVWRALPPIVIGHALSIAVVLVAVAAMEIVVPRGALHVVVATTLVAMGLFRLWRHRHPRFGGMQVGFADLTIWSFLMASAHGAGLMVLPFVMPAPPVAAATHEHAHHIASASVNVATANAMATAVHTMAYFVVMSLVAWVVYRKLGLRLLRTAWFDMDRAWAAALVVTGIFVLMK